MRWTRVRPRGGQGSGAPASSTTRGASSPTCPCRPSPGGGLHAGPCGGRHVSADGPSGSLAYGPSRPARGSPGRGARWCRCHEAGSRTLASSGAPWCSHAGPDGLGAGHGRAGRPSHRPCHAVPDVRHRRLSLRARTVPDASRSLTPGPGSAPVGADHGALVVARPEHGRRPCADSGNLPRERRVWPLVPPLPFQRLPARPPERSWQSGGTRWSVTGEYRQGMLGPWRSPSTARRSGHQRVSGGPAGRRRRPGRPCAGAPGARHRRETTGYVPSTVPASSPLVRPSRPEPTAPVASPCPCGSPRWLPLVRHRGAPGPPAAG
jgi:hypothetical protein